MQKPVLVIHGGAITHPEWDIIPNFEEKYHAALKKALDTGYKLLQKGKSAVDAVEACITVLEDTPYFNAGKGAAFTSNGKNELDASIMDGQTLEAGAVTQVTHIKNPIQAARIIMENSPHILLCRKGAEDFVKQYGISFVDPTYFRDERKWKQYLELKKEEREQKKIRAFKPSTVGAVALDMHGNLAAGTSTGGLENKHFGRIGDSPLIGAGTYANNSTCAVSSTGFGEYFMRGVVAYDISARIEYLHQPLKQAAEDAIMKKQIELWERGGISSTNTDGSTGLGGIIGVDRKGNITMTFNCAGMYRGSIDKNGVLFTGILK